FLVKGDRRTYPDLVTPRGLDEIAKYAQAIGPAKSLIIPRTPNDTLGSPTSLVADAHAQGIHVHAWTFRAENAFLPSDLRSGVDPKSFGNLEAEVRAFLSAGVDGFFTDHADIGVRARNASA